MASGRLAVYVQLRELPPTIVYGPMPPSAPPPEQSTVALIPTLTTSETELIVASGAPVGLDTVMLPETAHAESVGPVELTSTVYSDVPDSPLNRSHVAGSTDLSMVQS